MPTYMKAFRLADLQRYPKWSAATALEADTIVYLREDRAVVSDCFGAGSVLFQSADDEWEWFCREELGFEKPDWEAESLRIRKRQPTRDS
jgi:hypothetical protein